MARDSREGHGDRKAVDFAGTQSVAFGGEGDRARFARPTSMPRRKRRPTALTR